MTDSNTSAKGPWALVRREPLLLFVVLGAVLYGAWKIAGIELIAEKRLL